MLASLVLAAAATATALEPEGDPSPMDRAAAFVAAFDAGDAEALARVFVEHFERGPATVEAALPRARAFLAMREEMGRFEVHRVRELASGSVSVLGRSAKKGEWHDFQFMVGERPPGKLKGLFLAQATAPVDLPEGPIDDPKTIAWLHEHVRELEKGEGFSGAVLVAKGGKTLLAEAAGFADKEARVANTVDTRFSLGSGNKMFTAIAVARLESDGKLSLDDLVGKHLPDWPNAAVREKVTIRQLLTHTSGIPDFWTPEFERNRASIRSAEDIVPYFVERPLEFEPGARFAYSNSGFIVLGRLVEKVTGKDYFDVIRETVYAPAGMKATDSYPTDGSITGLARPYTDFGPDGRPVRGTWRRDERTGRGSAAGGGFSTVGDVLRFDEALRSGKLLPPDRTEALLRGAVDMLPGGEERYALGFIESTRNGVRAIGHGGMAPGCFFEYRAYPDSGVVLVVFANHDSAASMDLFKRLREIAERRPEAARQRR
jgi:CubicO group peptidase (beta-lactamase class C family)